MSRAAQRFNPVAILAALERERVDYVLIGGLAQVLRGADAVTTGVDICPSFARGNLDRLARAVGQLRRPGASPADLSEEALDREQVLRQRTPVGRLGVAGSPAGVPNGYVDLRRAATREDLGGGLRPLVASSGDLAAMTAAMGRRKDLERLAMLRRIVELEAGRPQPLPATTEIPSRASGRSSRRGRRIAP